MVDTVLLSSEVSPLVPNVPIVEPQTGNPTSYFQTLIHTWLKEKKITEDQLFGLGLDGLADVDTVSDVPTEGDLLIFDGTFWVPFAPGTSGDVLTSNGDTNMPTWETPDPGSASDWVDLTFSGSSSSKWNPGGLGLQTVFSSDQVITLTGIDKIEVVLQCDRDTGEGMAVFVSPDGAQSYGFVIQTDNNSVVYRWSTAAGGSSIVGTPGSTGQNRGGNHEIRGLIHCGKAGQTNRVWGVINSGASAGGVDSVVSVLGSAVHVWVRVPNDLTSNIINCKYRINSPGF